MHSGKKQGPAGNQARDLSLAKNCLLGKKLVPEYKPLALASQNTETKKKVSSNFKV